MKRLRPACLLACLVLLGAFQALGADPARTPKPLSDEPPAAQAGAAQSGAVKSQAAFGAAQAKEKPLTVSPKPLALAQETSAAVSPKPLAQTAQRPAATQPAQLAQAAPAKGQAGHASAQAQEKPAAAQAKPARKPGQQVDPFAESEPPTPLKASTFLPKSLLHGTDYRLDETVTTDGYVNIYTLRSRFGDFKVYSTPLLVARIDEIRAMAQMEKVSGAKEFGKGVVNGGANVLKGAANLITDPVNTVSSTFSGVGKLFERAEESIAGSKASKYEDGAGYGAIGFSATKREYAQAFGVDPYSTNSVMQKKLNGVTSAGYAGGLTSMGLKMLIPGGVGIAVSSVGGVNWLGEVDLALPPTDLRRNNRETLKKMGVGQDLSAQFLDNDEFTPTQQSLLVKALAKMEQTGGRDLFIRVAARSGDQEQTLFRQRMAQLYSAYDRKVERVERFLELGRLMGAKTRSGKVLLCFPLDRLVWTQALADRTRGMGKAVAEANPTAVELWICGPATPLARKQVAALGWTLKEHCNRELLGETF